MKWSKAFSVILLTPIGLIAYNSLDDFPILILSEFASAFTLLALSISAISLMVHASRYQYQSHRSLTFVCLLLAYVFLGGKMDIQISDHSDLHIVSINVAQFGNDTIHARGIAALIKGLNPDIVVLQEFGLYYKWPNTAVVAAQFSKKIGLSEYHFEPHKDNIFGTAIFAKFPIRESELVYNQISQTSEGWIHHLDINGTSLFVANVQLESYNFQNVGSDVLAMTMVQKRQLNQVKMLLKRLSDKHKSIIVGDFNAIPYSKIYNVTAREYEDSMAEMGNGWQSTYVKLPIRIDYLFHSKDIKVGRADALYTEHSDHKVLSVHIDL
ncbi:MAG: endonuclease/exonuclease/phosphatase family protein [Flavobacteriales bacterium]|nr:endonuclease/exonuclease/phosphatase family protein [Flavobacteriales bacterium]